MAAVTVAAVQAAYILMDQRACLDKAVTLLHQAADAGARIVVFPEVYIREHPSGSTPDRFGTATRTGTRCWSIRPSWCPAP
jgi:predicted amidohydrolase